MRVHSKQFEIINKINLSLFFFKMPSTHIEETNSSELIKVFFYGTLKKNQPNYEHTLRNRAKFLSEAVTLEKWPLIIGTNLNIPFLLNKPGYGKVQLQLEKFENFI